jgi:CheY-like chemotaxis protein
MPETACHPSADSRPLALVVEDEPVTRLLAAKLLSQLGFRVACAARGDEGLDTAMALRPALVLTDALLPKLDGRELCKRLKDAPETGKTRIIVMSGLYTKTQNRTDALRTFKADGYLKKPIDLADLRAEVERVLPGGPLSKPAEF